VPASLGEAVATLNTTLLGLLPAAADGRDCSAPEAMRRSCDRKGFLDILIEVEKL